MVASLSQSYAFHAISAHVFLKAEVNGTQLVETKMWLVFFDDF